MRTVPVKVSDNLDLLAGCPVLAPLPPADQEALAGFMRLQRYEAGEWLFRQEERADAFFVIRKGRVEVFRAGRDGREQILHVLGPGELVGEVPVFQGRRFPAGARAAEPLEALYVPGDAFLELTQHHPQLLLDMLAVLSQRLRGFVALIDDLALKEVSARLAKFLLDRAVLGQSSAVQLDGTKAALAARLGTVSETLSRTLRKMQDRGIISVQGNHISLLDQQALAHLAAGEKL